MLLAAASLVFSGIAQAAISPPLSWIWLHLVSWVPAFAVFSRLEGRRALLAGWLVGLVAELAIYCWLPGTIARFGGFPVPVAVVLWLLFAAGTGFYTAVVAWGFARIRRASGDWWPFAIPVWFCALEFLNPQLFGYLQGVAWYQVPSVFLVVAATGVSGMSFLVIVCNALVLQGLEGTPEGGRGVATRGWRLRAGLFAVLVAAAAAYSHVRLAGIAAAEQAVEPLRIAIIQPRHTIPLRDQMERQSGDAFAKDHIALSREAMAAASGPIHAFVWPEGALRVDPSRRANAAVPEFARETGSEVWTGANHWDYERGHVRSAHNSAFRIRTDGTIDRRYDKNVLVPFGEFMPMKSVFPFLAKIEIPGNFEAGDEVPVYESGSARFVFLVCYEAIRNRFVREALGSEGNLLVNVTVDAWYGELSEQSQHLMLAAIQSALHGVPLVRSTSTGISAFVDARGVMTARSGNFTREFLVEEVRPVRVPSLYSWAGEWFAWTCVALSAALLVLSRRRGVRGSGRAVAGDAAEGTRGEAAESTRGEAD
jgi:apolipoprotein N-acyltransferase